MTRPLAVLTPKSGQDWKVAATQDALNRRDNRVIKIKDFLRFFYFALISKIQEYLLQPL